MTFYIFGQAAVNTKKIGFFRVVDIHGSFPMTRSMKHLDSWLMS
jgi:hypothetical protein